jgi:hypothetical protein
MLTKAESPVKIPEGPHLYLFPRVFVGIRKDIRQKINKNAGDKINVKIKERE